jgi:hypothetical protein
MIKNLAAAETGSCDPLIVLADSWANALSRRSKSLLAGCPTRMPLSLGRVSVNSSIAQESNPAKLAAIPAALRPASNGPSLQYRQHHRVEEPRIDDHEFRPRIGDFRLPLRYLR